MILYILLFYFLIYLSCLWSLVFFLLSLVISSFLIYQKEARTHTHTQSPSDARCIKLTYQKYKVTLQETPNNWKEKKEVGNNN